MGTSLKGKVALITGGSRGIGAAIARKFASEGADIAITYMGTHEQAEAICCSCREHYHVTARAYRCNVKSLRDSKRTVKEVKTDFDTIHILVNNAGITRDRLLALMSEEDFDEVVDTNLKGTFNMTRQCVGTFMRNSDGCIINISSVSGLMGNAGQANYAASKAGVVGFTKSVARELARKGIRCNAIAPGFILTSMTDALDVDMVSERIPLGFMGKPADVADAALYLATARYVTGEVIRVDGGIAM